MAGAKMAKSTGNIERVGDLLERGVSARALRYVLIAVHYRAALNYTDASLAAAGSALERLDALLAALAAYREERPGRCRPWPSSSSTTRAGFERALDDDLNIAPALAVLFDFVREINRRIDARALSTADAGIVTSFLHDLDRVLGIGPDLVDEALDARARRRSSRHAPPPAPRGTGRHRTDSAMSLPGPGIVVEDTRDGQRWRRLEDPHG